MHISIIKSVQNGKVYYFKPLRRCYPDDNGRVQKETFANLSHLANEAIDLLKVHLACRSLVDASQAFAIVRTRIYGPGQAVLEAGRLQRQDQIGLRVGKVFDRYKVGKHFDCRIDDDSFRLPRRQDHIDSEAALDGVYVICTSRSAQDLSTADCVRHYKAVTRVERAFRTLKTTDLQIRAIDHRLADRVRAHIFLCMLAYYVAWHMREAWRPLLFPDEELPDRARRRDPVAPSTSSDGAKRKKSTRETEDGAPLHSFRTLMEELATLTRNACRTPGEVGSSQSEFELETQPRATQKHAVKLLQGIRIP